MLLDIPFLWRFFPVTILIITFLHNFAFNAGTFYLALFHQVTTWRSWVPLVINTISRPQTVRHPLRLALSFSLTRLVHRWPRCLPPGLSGIGKNEATIRARKIILFRSDCCCLQLVSVCNNAFLPKQFLYSSAGLLSALDEHSSVLTQIIYPLVAGIGLGMLFHAPYQIFANALKPHELATGTSAFFLVRFTGATVGLVSRIFLSNYSADGRYRPSLAPFFMLRLQLIFLPVFFLRILDHQFITRNLLHLSRRNLDPKCCMLFHLQSRYSVHVIQLGTFD